MDKYEELLKYSNPQKVLKRLCKYLPGVDLYLSTRKGKKYMIQNSQGGWIHFGDMNYADYTRHKDDVRRINYIQRATNIKGDWKDDKYSPNNLALHLLWDYVE
jgi:hypothetical protein